MIGKTMLSNRWLPRQGEECHIEASENAKFHSGPHGRLLIEEPAWGRKVTWCIRLVPIGEWYDADWDCIGYHEQPEPEHNQMTVFGVLAKKA